MSYKDYYFNKKLCAGIELIVEIERTSKKKAAELLMKAGLSSYMGGNLTTYVESEHAVRELHQKVKLTRFVLELRKLAKSKGMDISKFI